MLLFTAVPALSQVRYWGEPRERGEILTSDLSSHSRQWSRVGCQEIEVTVVVADPRPGLPALTVSRGCESYVVGQHVTLQRRADRPARAYLEPIPLPWFFLGSVAAYVLIVGVCGLWIGLTEAAGRREDRTAAGSSPVSAR